MIIAYIMSVAITLALNGCTNVHASTASNEVVQQSNKVAPSLKERAAKSGMVRVIVSFNLAPEGFRLDREIAKDRLLSELQGSAFKVVHRLKETASIVLSVGPDALEILNLSPLVSRVNEDKEGSFSRAIFLLFGYMIFYKRCRD